VTMARARELFNDGIKSYKAGEYRVASMCWAEAAIAAGEEQDIVLQYAALVWQADVLYLSGEIARALGRLLAAYDLEIYNQDASFGSFEQWMRRKLFIQQLITGLRGMSATREALVELTEFSATHRPPPWDIPVLQGNISRTQGRWTEALAQYETARAQFNSHGSGFTQCGFASKAVSCCLRLHLWSAADDWIAAIRQEDEWQNGWADIISHFQGTARFELARARGDSYFRLRSLFQAIEAVPASVDSLTKDRHLARLAFALLDPHGGDPAHSGHPTRRTLPRLPDSRENVHDVFDYVRAILDYRLACLRFSANVPPVDDEYHEAPPLPPLRITDQQDFLRRLKRARIVLAAARRRARAIDIAFECNWRQQDIDRRARAIEAIAHAYAHAKEELMT